MNSKALRLFTTILILNITIGYATIPIFFPGNTPELQPSDVDSGAYDNLDHSDPHLCTRTCKAGEPPRICYYKFYLEPYTVLGGACGQCPTIRDDCFKSQCVTADGYEKPILTVNRRLPAPSIQVCHGDTIIVDVINQMPGSSTSIHWHGIRQRETPWMDGVPMVTQCPILEGQTYRYRYLADEPGTFFWHSHDGLQKADGIVGSLVIRQPDTENPIRSLYDFDLPSHTLIVQDWMHPMSSEGLPGLIKKLTGQNPDSYLINGRGVFVRGLYDLYGPDKTPLTEFKVKHGHRYRFRIVSGACLACPFRVTVQNHKMKVISIDDMPIEPRTVDSIVMSAGERYDVVIESLQPAASYWILVRGMGGCTGASQAAVLQYEGSPTTKPTLPHWDALLGYNAGYVSDMLTGERYDVVIESLQPAASYWILVRGMGGCTGASQAAMLQYEGSPTTKPTLPHWDVLLGYNAGYVSDMVTGLGERYDVVIESLQPAASYWILVRGMGGCTGASQAAVLQYEGSPTTKPTLPHWDALLGYNAGYTMNPRNSKCNNASLERGVCVSQLRAKAKTPKSILRSKPDMRLTMAFGFHTYTHQELFESNSYHKFFVPVPLFNSHLAAIINNVSNVVPPSPLLTQVSDIPPETFCPAGGCKEEWCECLHVIKVPLGAVVEMIIADTSSPSIAGITHPFHIHGHDFYILEQGVFTEPFPRALENLQMRLKGERKIKDHLPAKDTVTVPATGYAVVRVLADNPGYWLYHCHFSYHLSAGMSAIIQVGERNQMKTAPADIPRCYQYKKWGGPLRHVEVRAVKGVNRGLGNSSVPAM